MESVKKCIAVIDGALPVGLIANAAAILGCTLGRRVREIVGEDTIDQQGERQAGIIQTPLPVLTADQEAIRQLYCQAKETYGDEMEIIAFSDLARKSKNYDEYKMRMREKKSGQLSYLGICLYGSKKQINHLTGNLPTLK